MATLPRPRFFMSARKTHQAARNVPRLIFLVSLLCTLAIHIVGAQQAVQGELGALQTVTVTDKDFAFRFAFDLEAGDTIYASAYDPTRQMALEISLIEPNGVMLAQAYPNAIGTVLPPFTVASGGTYTVEIVRPDWASQQTGTFDLIVDRVAFTAVKPDGVYTGRILYAGAAAFFTYTGKRNELFRFAASGDSLAFYMLAQDGNTFVNTDIQDELLGALNILPEDGTFVAFLQTADPEGSDYTLQLKPITPITVEAGQGVYTGTYTESTTPILKLAALAEQPWRITSQELQDVSSYLEIYSLADPTFPLATDYGSGPNGIPRIDPFIAPADGDYLIVLYVDDGQPGERELNYEITLETGELRTLEVGTAVNSSVTADDNLANYFYIGLTGDALRVTIERTSEEGQPSLRVVSEFDEVISFYTRSGSKAVFEIILPVDGLYRFEVRDASYSASKMDFSLLIEASE